MQFLMNKRDKLFKLYGNENNLTLKATNYNNFTETRNSVMSKIKEFKKQYYTSSNKISQTLKKLGMEFNQLIS